MAALPLEGHDDYAKVAQLVQPVHMPRSDAPPNPMKRIDPFMFGSRYLEEGDDVFAYNAWDHVEADPEYLAYAEVQYERQRDAPVSDFDKKRFNADPVKWWNLFYKNNESNFFKNRKWLQQEFPVLAEVTKPEAGRKVVLEVGAGAGNSAFPILANNENPLLKVHACDYSKKAVEVMRASEHYDEKFMSADVWDVTGEGENALPPGLEEGSVDVVVMVFIFSALAPEEWERAVANIHRVLKPGGLVLFRDYGRGDLAQVRFKKGRWMDDNFYARGDGTRVYFFDKNQLRHIWGKWSLEHGIPEFNAAAAGDDDAAVAGEQQREEDQQEQKTTIPVAAGFDVLNISIDRRLIVNRREKLKMYRCWMQARFVKRITGADSSSPSSLETSATATPTSETEVPN
ncbi:hypothetical protein AJ80_04678 [Polytolypa hystricis UAMH7299]|uniref:tRNA N(3)-methylcytidine methyltransferase n=1 Tax=Polytolypa hystricis (strain UAMH7299) TaxID=1447883 RepID=A0A2B7Y9C9_POLH7|nr:hypothetical protein AJ80_04678 [Polytolypa hystricis UAMH7299]